MDEWMDGQTEGQPENIMPSDLSMRDKKPKNVT